MGIMKTVSIMFFIDYMVYLDKDHAGITFDNPTGTDTHYKNKHKTKPVRKCFRLSFVLILRLKCFTAYQNSIKNLRC